MTVRQPNKKRTRGSRSGALEKRAIQDVDEVSGYLSLSCEGNITTGLTPVAVVNASDIAVVVTGKS